MIRAGNPLSLQRLLLDCNDFNRVRFLVTQFIDKHSNEMVKYKSNSDILIATAQSSTRK